MIVDIRLLSRSPHVSVRGCERERKKEKENESKSERERVEYTE